MTANWPISRVRGVWGLLVSAMFAIGAAPAAVKAQADPSRSAISLEYAVRQALTQYPSVLAAGLTAAGARSAVGEEKAARLPTVVLAGSATRYEDPMLVTPIHGFSPGLTPPFDRTLLQGGATVSYTLFDGGTRGSRVRQAESRADAAIAGRSAAEQTLVARVVGAYAGILTQRQVLAATELRLEALRAERDRAAQRVAVGRGAEVESLRAEAALAVAEAARVRVLAARDVDERDLSRLTGWSPEQIREGALPDIEVRELAPVPRGELLARALESSPLAAEARQQARAADAAAAVVRGARWPELRLVGAYVDRGSASGTFTGEWNAGLQLSYPVFTGGAVGSRVRRAEAARGAAHEQSRLADLHVGEAVDGALARVEEAHARVEALRRAEASLTEVTRIERLSLDAGAGTQPDYLRAEADLLAVRADLAAAGYGLVVARAELARATGTLSLAWVAGNVESKP